MKRLAYLTMILTALLVVLPQWTFAQEETTATDELVSLVGKAIVEETTRRSEEVKKAKEILDVILKDGTAEEQEKAKRNYDEAESRYRDSAKKLDQARVDAIAEQCGKSPAEIQAMRDSGMGWGNIAKECGIHPSVSGKGNGNGKDKKPKKEKKK